MQIVTVIIIIMIGVVKIETSGVQLLVMLSAPCENELPTHILAHTSPSSFRLVRSILKHAQVP